MFPYYDLRRAVIFSLLRHLLRSTNRVDGLSIVQTSVVYRALSNTEIIVRLSVTTPLRSWAPSDNYRDTTLRKCERSEHSRVEVCCREQVVRNDGKSSSTELWSSWELRKLRTTYTVWSLG